MSVYTVISEEGLGQFIQRFDIGTLLSYRGIDEGIENTNYFVDTDRGEYVLTLFEWLEDDQLPYFIDLMCHVADAGLPCPHPVADRQGHTLHKLMGKPTALITRLPGRTIKKPSVAQCQQVGDILAKMHLVMRGFEDHSENIRDISWFKAQTNKIQSKLSKDDSTLLNDEIKHQSKQLSDALPDGTIHADLFKDNALFDNERLSGVIDFYYACHAKLLYDVAVAVNDWCRLADQHLSRPHYEALINAYHLIRPFEPLERDEWRTILRRAALRFWLSRLRDKLFPKDGAITHIKDPDIFKNILLLCREEDYELC